MASAEDVERSPEGATPPAESSADPPQSTERNESPDREEASSSQQNADDQTPQLRFSFDAAPWRMVLGWLADEAEMALHVASLPSGSLTYSDPNAYTPEEAINRLNLFLIPEGYSLIRNGRLLSVISLEDPQSVPQLEAMAEMVPIESLDERGGNEVVRCLFPIGEIDADDAVDELSGINLMTQPVVLPESNQLLITGIVSKLRGVREILKPLGEELADDEEIVKRFELEHLSVEEVMRVVRPHLGLQPEEMVGLDLSISADPEDSSMFVTGSEETVNLFESLVEIVDVPGNVPDQSGDAELRSHPVSGDNLRAVYEVLQTLLSGESIRLTMEQESNSIVALAPRKTHERIVSTIEELSAPSVDFEVVELKSVDPYFAVSLLNQMFGIDPDMNRDQRERIDAPKIDADLENNRLFVRGKPSQIEQVRTVIAKLDRGESVGAAGDGKRGLRVLPMRRSQAETALRSAKEFWSGDGRVIVYPPAIKEGRRVIERAIHPEAAAEASDEKIPTGSESRGGPDGDDFTSTKAIGAGKTNGAANANRLPASPFDAAEALVSTENALPDADRSGEDAAGETPPTPSGGSDQPLIKTQLTPRGIVIQSDDPKASEQFEDYLRSITGGGSDTPSPPVVYYLKYVKADEATRMLADLLDGAMSLSELSGAGSSGSGLVSSAANSYSLGSLLYSQEGMTTMTAGSATVVSDARLNRLIVQGTSEDIELIERYLEIVDKEASITSVETYGQSHVIELMHTEAEAVAEAIRKAYAGRIAEDDQQQPGQRRGRDGDDDRRRDEDRREPTTKEAESREPMMAISVHEPSNSLIVTAPDSLYSEVEKLVTIIDTRSEESIQVISPRNPEAVQTLLEDMLGSDSRRGRRSRRRNR